MRILALGLFLSFQSFAHASVGDWAQFIGSATRECSSNSIPMKSRLTVTGEDKNLKVRSVLVERSLDGVLTSEIIKLPLIDGELIDGEYKLRDFCRKMSGTIEVVKVPAGNLQSCKVSTKGEEGWNIETWVGDVSLAVIAWTGKKDAFGDGSCVQSVDQKLTDFGTEQ